MNSQRWSRTGPGVLLASGYVFGVRCQTRWVVLIALLATPPSSNDIDTQPQAVVTTAQAAMRSPASSLALALGQGRLRLVNNRCYGNTQDSARVLCLVGTSHLPVYIHSNMSRQSHHTLTRRAAVL